MIIGYKEVSAALSALPNTMTDKMWSDINYDRAKILVNREKLEAPEGPSGDLVDSITAIKLRRERLGTVWVGPKKRKAPHAHLVHDGTQKRDKNGPNRGVMPKNPFAKRAFEREKGPLERALGDSTAKVLKRTIKKYV